MRIVSMLPGRGMKEGAGLPSPSSGYRRYLYLIWNFFWKLVKLNLLFIVFSIPLFTLPAALSAVSGVCRKLIDDGNVFVWEDFRDEFKSGFKKSIPPGVLFFVLLFVSYYLFSLGLTNSRSIYGIFFNAGGLAILLTVTVWSGYFFVISAAFDQPADLLLKNSFIFMIINGKHSTGILCIQAIKVFILISLFPVSIFLILLVLPVLTQYTICFILLSVIKTGTE